MLFTPPPPVTNCHTFSDPLPLERDVFYGRPFYCNIWYYNPALPSFDTNTYKKFQLIVSFNAYIKT